MITQLPLQNNYIKDIVIFALVKVSINLAYQEIYLKVTGLLHQYACQLVFHQKLTLNIIPGIFLSNHYWIDWIAE